MKSYTGNLKLALNAVLCLGLLLLAAVAMAMGEAKMAEATGAPFTRPRIDWSVPAKTERAVFALG